MNAMVASCCSCDVLRDVDGFRALSPPSGALVVRYGDGNEPCAIERRECQCGDVVTAMLDRKGHAVPLAISAILRGLTGGFADVPPPVGSAGRWMRITKRYLIAVLRYNDNPTPALLAIRNGWERANDKAKQ